MMQSNEAMATTRTGERADAETAWAAVVDRDRRYDGRSDGALGGYRWGEARKRRLLEGEKCRSAGGER